MNFFKNTHVLYLFIIFTVLCTLPVLIVNRFDPFSANKLFMTGSSPTNHENYAILSQVVSMPEGRLQIGARKPAINLTWTS